MKTKENKNIIETKETKESKENKNLTPTNSECSLDSLNYEEDEDNKDIVYNYIPRSYTNDGFVYIPLRQARLTWSKSEGSLPLFYSLEKKN